MTEDELRARTDQDARSIMTACIERWQTGTFAADLNDRVLDVFVDTVDHYAAEPGERGSAQADEMLYILGAEVGSIAKIAAAILEVWAKESGKTMYMLYGRALDHLDGKTG